MNLSIHHIAIICSNIEQSKRFYVDILGFSILAEHYRESRNSWKVDLAINEHTQLELFTFPNAPTRPSHPEAIGLRHLAFHVDNLEEVARHLLGHALEIESIRVDEYTGKRFFFTKDPDGLPIEFYER
jgi:glyoxylase I family protein